MSLRELILKDKFQKMCHPKFVATAKSQKINLSKSMAETLYLHGRKNIPQSLLVGNKPQPFIR